MSIIPPRGNVTAFFHEFGTRGYSPKGRYGEGCSQYLCTTGLIVQDSDIPNIVEVVRSLPPDAHLGKLVDSLAPRFPIRVCAGIIDKPANWAHYRRDPWPPHQVAYEGALQRVQMETSNDWRKGTRAGIAFVNSSANKQDMAALASFHRSLVTSGSQMVDMKFTNIADELEVIHHHPEMASLAKLLGQPIYDQIATHSTRGPSCFDQLPFEESYELVRPLICAKAGRVKGYGIAFIPGKNATEITPPIVPAAA